MFPPLLFFSPFTFITSFTFIFLLFLYWSNLSFLTFISHIFPSVVSHLLSFHFTFAFLSSKVLTCLLFTNYQLFYLHTFLSSIIFLFSPLFIFIFYITWFLFWTSSRNFSTTSICSLTIPIFNLLISWKKISLPKVLHSSFFVDKFLAFQNMR